MCPRRRAHTQKTSYQGAIISRVLYPQAVSLRTGLRWQPFIWSPDCSGALAANPGRSGRSTPTHLAAGARPLFGLAPGGVCRAVAVASPPVRFYRTLSPLPVPLSGPSAVCSLWHFPLPPLRRAGGRYPPPLLRGARTFLAAQRPRGCLRPPDAAPIGAASGFGKRLSLRCLPAAASTPARRSRRPPAVRPRTATTG